MQGPSKDTGQSHRRRRKTAMAGGGRPALEMLALLAEDPETEVVCIWDPDRTALIFRLEELGFTFSERLRPKLLDDFRQLEAMTGLDSIIDASFNLQIRRSLDQLLQKTAPVLSARAAQLLWGLKLGKDVGLGSQLEGLRSFLEEIDLLRHETELFEVLLQLGLILTRSEAAELYLFRPEDQEPILVYAVSPLRNLDSPNGGGGGRGRHLRTGIMATNSILVQKVVESRRPVLLPGNGASASPGPKQEPVKQEQEIPALAVPIMLDEELVGIMEFFRDASSGPFSKTELEACSRLGTAIARYVGKVLNLQEMRELSVGETLRTEIKAVLNSQLSLEEKLARGVEKIHQILDACHAHFYLKERSSDHLILQASTTQASQVCGMMKVRMGEGFVGEVAKTLQPVFLKGGSPSFPSGNVPAILYLPVTSGESLCGVLCLERLPARISTSKVIKLMEEVGGEFAQVISADLQHRRMSHKLMRFSLVQEEGLGLLSEAEREQLSVKIAASTAMVMDAQVVIFRTFEAKGKRLLVASTHGLHKNEMDSRLVQMDGLVALKAFQSRSAQNLEDLKKLDQALPSNFPYRFGICQPLSCEGKILGTISVYNKVSSQSSGSNTFDQDDLEIMDKFSYYIGKALNNVQEAQERSNLITIDELTGFRNERYLMVRLPEELRRAERYHRSLSLMIFEVKGDPKIQPSEGSLNEKEFIKQIAEILQDTFRNVDILVRLKGTQFAILMPDTTEVVTGAATRLARSLASLPLKIFIGHATFPSEARTDQELLEKASRLSEVGGAL